MVRRLALLALALVCVTFGLSLVLSEVGVLFLAAVSAAETAVAEGLLAVVTIALALGGRRMLRRRVLSASSRRSRAPVSECATH